MHPSDVVLVTGAGGFTGRVLVPALRQAGASVVGVGYHDEPGVEQAVDLLDPEGLAAMVERVAPTHVVHLAAISAPTHTPVAEIYAANVVGTVNLLEALAKRAQGLKHVLLPSSATLYAPPADGRPIAEDNPLAPGGHYAASKLAMEQAAAFFAERLPIQVVRPFNYTGAGQRANFFAPKVVEHFASGAQTLRVGDLSVSRDISDVVDVVEAIRRLLSGPPVGAPLNICSGRAVQLSQVVKMVSAIAGRAIEVVVDPAFVRPGEPSRVVGSRARLEAAVGSWPLRPLEATLRDMYREARARSAAAA